MKLSTKLRNVNLYHLADSVVYVVFCAFLLAVLGVVIVHRDDFTVHAQSQTQLFSASSGDTTCKFHTNAATPTTIDFTCTNPRGTFGGYYAPAAANTATDGITIGLSAGVGNTGNEVCMLGVNMTANPVTIGSFGTIPPTSVVFQCAGGSASTPISLTPPVQSLKKGKK